MMSDARVYDHCHHEPSRQPPTEAETEALSVDPFAAPVKDMMSAPLGGGPGDELLLVSRGTGSFSCQTVIQSSTTGPDGEVYTERFASSAVGNVPARAQEVQQAYSSDGTGVEKASLEQQLEGHGHKEVHEHNRLTGERRRTDMVLGDVPPTITAPYAEFKKAWQERAVPVMPGHPGGGAQELLRNTAAAFELPSSDGPRAEALRA